jgi:hypothetical protein
MKQEHEELIRAFGMCAAYYDLQGASEGNTEADKCDALDMAEQLREDQQRIIEEAEHDG